MSSAITPGFVSPDGTPNLIRKEHEEQMEEFYLENEFLFVDEKWGVLEKNGVSPLVREQLSLLLGAGRVQRSSRVLVWGGSAALAQELCVATSPESLAVTHLSMAVLGTVKEMNDDVFCWLGNVEDLPESYGPFDAVFLNSLIVTAYSPADLLRSVVGLCRPGECDLSEKYSVFRLNVSFLCSSGQCLLVEVSPCKPEVRTVEAFSFPMESFQFMTFE